MMICPICEWDDTITHNTCTSCGASFTLGRRIPDPDPAKELEFFIRESKPGTRFRTPSGEEFLKLVEDRPYIQNAWAGLSDGKLYHYSFLLKR
jgi:hypothetical protein